MRDATAQRGVAEHASGMPVVLQQVSRLDLAGACGAEMFPPPGWANVPSLPMRQAWLPAPDPGLRRAQVWLAATTTSFVVLAELDDVDIHSRGERHNDPLWDLGDVFEIFVRQTARPDYFEFHVAPNGVTVDLHYPWLYASRANGVGQYMRAETLFRSCAIADPARNRWRVAAEIPVDRLVPPECARGKGTWQFSFSRYDCGPGRPEVVSSTSAHAIADFHRAEEWLLFIAPPFESDREPSNPNAGVKPSAT
jgi:hypothetical protein